MLLIGRVFIAVGNVELSRKSISALFIGGVLLTSFGFYRLFGRGDEGFISVWRISTIVISLLAAALPWLSIAWMRRPSTAKLISLSIVVISVCSGILEMTSELRFRSETPQQGTIDYLRENADSNDVVMIPLQLTDLRMNAAVAVVADDHLVHGLQLPELLSRQESVREFYEEAITKEQLMRLRVNYGCTSIVLPINKEIPIDLPLQEVYRDAYYRVMRLRVNPHLSQNPADRPR